MNSLSKKEAAYNIKQEKLANGSFMLPEGVEAQQRNQIKSNHEDNG